MPDDLNAPVTPEERLAAVMEVAHPSAIRTMQAEGWSDDVAARWFAVGHPTAMLDALALSRRRERALREALESAQRPTDWTEAERRLRDP